MWLVVPEKSKLRKCDGRTDEQTEKLYTPQLSLAGYKNQFHQKLYRQWAYGTK